MLHALLEVLSGDGPEYDSNDIDYNAPLCMCYNINYEDQPKEAPRLMPPDQSPCSHAIYLSEKADHLRARQVDLEAGEVELERQR